MAPSAAAASMAARACAMLRALSAVTETWHMATLNWFTEWKYGTHSKVRSSLDLIQKSKPKESEAGRHLGERRGRELEGGRGARLLRAEGGGGGGGHGGDAAEWEAGGGEASSAGGARQGQARGEERGGSGCGCGSGSHLMRGAAVV